MERCIKPWEVNTQHPLFIKEWEEADQIEHGTKPRKRKLVGMSSSSSRPSPSPSSESASGPLSRGSTSSIAHNHSRSVSTSTTTLSSSEGGASTTSLLQASSNQSSSSVSTTRSPVRSPAPRISATTSHDSSPSTSRTYFDSSPSLVHQQLQSQLGLLRIQMLSNTIRAHAPSHLLPSATPTVPAIQSIRPFNPPRTTSSSSASSQPNPIARHWPPSSIHLEAVKIQSRRTTKDGRVKVKIVVGDARVDQCGICLEQFRVGQGAEEVAAVTSCNHIFHETCLKTWLIGIAEIPAAHNCPMCRAPLLPTS